MYRLLYYYLTTTLLWVGKKGIAGSQSCGTLGVFIKMSGIGCRHFLSLPHPLPLLPVFLICRVKVLFTSCAVLEMPAMQDKQNLIAFNCKLCS